MDLGNFYNSYPRKIRLNMMLVPTLPQMCQMNSSNIKIECTRESKQLYSLCDQLPGALIYLHFNNNNNNNNLFFIDYACCELCKMW